MKNPYLAKLLLLLLFVCAGFTGAFAQTGSVSGRVVDEKNEGLPGVTILIEGTPLGNSTNSDGTYSIQNVPAGARTLVVSFVGFTTSRIPVTVTAGQNTALASSTLNENTTLLNEAVVVGYGTVKKQDVTGSVTAISSREFVQGQITTPEQLINGKVAGVQITSNSGQPGVGSTIRIRGGSSLTASNDPLVVIDGVPVDNSEVKGAPSALSLINPNDIETFTVLKDASATAIYGSRASNGVILITTKKGLQGEKLRVNFNTQFSRSTNSNQVDVLSADEVRTIVNVRGTEDQKALLGTANTNWQDVIYQTAYTSDNNLSLTGSLGQLPFRASVGYLNQDGVLKTNNLKRNSASLSLTPRLFDDHLRVDVNVKGTWVDNRFADQGVIGTATFFDPTQPVYTTTGAYGGYFQFIDPAGVLVGLAPSNPLARLEQRRDRSTVKRSIGNVQLDYKLHFFPDVRANLNLGYDITRSNGSTFVPAEVAASEFTRKGVNNSYSQQRDNKLLEFYLNYTKELPNNLGRLELLGGHSYQDFLRNEPFAFDFQASGQLNNPLQAAENPTKSQSTLISYYGRLNYSLRDRYLLTATLRNDASSRFLKKNRNGLFPAAALAWRIKEEGFLKSTNALSDLKLRLGYGITGQQDVFNNDYPALASYSQGFSTVQYPFGGVYYQTLRITPYDPNIKWEETTTYNAGLDYGFLDGRLLGTVDIYLRETKDLLSEITAAAGTNFSNRYLTNIGSLENRGLELGLTGEIVRGEADAFSWTLNANATFNRNKITKLNTIDDPNFAGLRVGGISGSTSSTIQVNSVGSAVNSFYVYKQKYDDNGKPIFPTSAGDGINAFEDLDGNGTINEKDLYRYHSPAPQAVLGLGSNMSYRHVNLAFTLRSYLGTYVYDNVNSINASYAKVLPPQAYLSTATRELLYSEFTADNNTLRLSDYWVQKASFLRMDNITLGYDFGSLIKESTNLRLSVAVQNVFVATKYKGLDPEIFNGIDNNLYPRPRTVTVGLNVGF